MALIIILLILGGLFVIAELILFPGLSIAGIIAVGCFTGACYLAFEGFGQDIGYLIVAVAVIIATLSIIISLRSTLWQKLSLKTKLKNTNEQQNSTLDKLIGTEAISISRLAPMGRIKIQGSNYEARSESGYINQDTTVEVIGRENQTLIVKIK